MPATPGVVTAVDTLTPAGAAVNKFMQSTITKSGIAPVSGQVKVPVKVPADKAWLNTTVMDRACADFNALNAVCIALALAL